MAVCCGGRTELVPLPQIGRLSDHAVQGLADGVSVLLRTNVWPGMPGEVINLFPFETTIDNRGERPVRIEYRDFALVDEEGRRVPPVMKTSLGSSDGLAARALPEGIVQPGDRMTGFLYFDRLDSGSVEFVAELHDATTGEPFATVEIPFDVE